MSADSLPASAPIEGAAVNDIFISYSRKDKAFVQTLDTALRAIDQTPWVDWESIQPTEDWWQAIESGIEGASTFIFVLTPDSVASKVCRKEVEYAVQHNKRLVPILRRDGFNSQEVHPAISRHHWLSFQDSDNFALAFEKLVQAIATDLPYVKAHTRLLVRAREWQQRSFDASFLLRGSDLADAKQWLDRSVDQTPEPTTLHCNYIQASDQAEIARQEEELRLLRMTPQQYRNRQALLNKVKHYWVKGVLENSLQDRALLELGIEERLDAIAHPWRLNLEAPDQPAKPLPPGMRTIDIFNQLGEGRTLLILGEPGAGKTTALLTLAQELITQAEQEIDRRIPVVFNLSSWLGHKQPIADWLVEELNTKYQVPKAIGQSYVQNQQLLLLLDGLDEVRAENRNACVAALNFFQQQHGCEIVVCSRIKDYEALSQRLEFQSAICMRSLTSTQIHQYLNSSNKNLVALNALLERDTALQDLAKSPLMLNIMILAYQGVELEQLPSMEIEEHRRHLFNSFIERMFKRQGVREKYPQQQTMNWLIELAQRMSQDSQSVFLIEGIQPHWLRTNLQKAAYRISVEMTVGLIWGFTLGIFSKVLNYSLDPMLGLAAGISSGLITGLLTGLLGCFYSGSNSGWLAGLTGGIVFCLVNLQLNDWVNLPLDQVQPFQPLNTLIFGLVYGVIAQRLIPQNIESGDTIRWSWDKGKQQCVVAMIWGLIAGFALLTIKWFLLTPHFYTLLCSTDSPSLEQWTGSVLINFLCREETTANPVAAIARALLGMAALGIFVGVYVGLILGFEKVAEVERRTIPNHGIWKSSVNALKLVFLTGPLAGLVSEFVWLIYFHSSPQTVSSNQAVSSDLIWWIHYGNHPTHGLLFSMSVAALVGLISGLVSGDNSGLMCLRHLHLRKLLWLNGYIPWNYARFLNYATERVFLQKVGNGYIFVHRLLLEHFAQLPTYHKNR
jgi:DNA polymerase III delta prime subunit